MNVEDTFWSIMILTFIIEIYLVFTNIIHVTYKLRYSLPPSLKSDNRANCYRQLAEYSRTAFIILLTIYNGLEIFWGGIWGTVKSDELCKLLFDVPIIYFYCGMACRILFVYARLILFK